MRRRVVSKEKELVVPFYSALIRYHLEYSVQAWETRYRNELLECIKMRAMNMTKRLKHSPVKTT